MRPRPSCRFTGPSGATAPVVAPAVAAGIFLAVSLALSACGGESDGDRRFRQIREELSRVQSDRDRVDQRLMALETKGADDGTGEVPRAEKAPPPPRVAPAATPALRVVRIGADGRETPVAGAEEAAAPPVDDGGARPMLRVTGGRGPRGAKASADRIEQTAPEPELPEQGGDLGGGAPRIREGAPRPSALNPEARQNYDGALALVRGGKCKEALDAFAGFLLRYPDHPNADNAMYWRGECYAKMGDLPRAIEQLEGTLARFPLGNKVPDALLKLGMAHEKLGNVAKAKEAWARLVREYPRSEATQRIPKKEAEGRP